MRDFLFLVSFDDVSTSWSPGELGWVRGLM